MDERSPIETASILDYLDGECFKNNEGTFGRMIRDDDDMTVEKCQGICFDDNEEILLADGRLDMMPVYAGVQNGNECWCGNIKPTTPADVQSECSKPCSGDNSQKCGGKRLVNLILKKSLNIFFQTISMFLDSGRLNVYQRFVKIFQHNGNEGFFQLKGADNTDKTDAMEKNPDNPEADLFSLLSKLDQYKRQGKIS